VKRVIVIASAVALLAACGSSHQSAPDPGNDVGGATPGTRGHVIQEPDGFRNVSFSCYGLDGVYVTSRGVTTGTALPSSVFVVPNDEHCR
jgi:hypothetical protein